MCFQKHSTNLVATDDLANADSIVTAKWNIQYPLFYSESCIKHLFPTRGMAWNNPPKPCQGDDLVLQAGAELLIEEAATRVEGTEANQSKADAWGWQEGSKGDSSDCHKKKRWENTNWEQKCTKKRLGMFINIKPLNEQNSAKPTKHTLVPLQF